MIHKSLLPSVCLAFVLRNFSFGVLGYITSWRNGTLSVCALPHGRLIREEGK